MEGTGNLIKDLMMLGSQGKKGIVYQLVRLGCVFEGGPDWNDWALYEQVQLMGEGRGGGGVQSKDGLVHVFRHLSLSGLM